MAGNSSIEDIGDGPWVSIVNTVNLVLIALLAFAGFKVVTKFIVRMGICMMFVNGFYILSGLILLNDLVIVYAVYFALPAKDLKVDKANDIPINIFTITNSIHSVFYIALVLFMVSSMV